MHFSVPITLKSILTFQKSGFGNVWCRVWAVLARASTLDHCVGLFRISRCISAKYPMTAEVEKLQKKLTAAKEEVETAKAAAEAKSDGYEVVLFRFIWKLSASCRLVFQTTG